jgi:hypothetical protein
MEREFAFRVTIRYWYAQINGNLARYEPVDILKNRSPE